MTGQAGIVPVDQSLLSPAALLATVAADYAIETPVLAGYLIRAQKLGAEPWTQGLCAL